MTVAAATTNWRIRFDTPGQLKAALIALCFGAVFYNVIYELQYTWSHDPNWSHGWIIPLFSAWFLYFHWEKIRQAPVRHAWAGLPIMLAGLGLYQWSLWGVQIGYVRPCAMMITLLGVIIMVCGLPVMRYAWLPWMYLFFAIPLPKRHYFQLTDPLRRLAATVTAGVMSLIPGLDIQRTGSMLECMYQGRLQVIGVEDACSGMRMLMTLCALGVAVAFLSNRPAWQRAVMVAACVPIAVFCNILRVTVTTYLFIFVDAKYAQGTYHTILGLLLLLIAFGLFSGLGWILSNLVVDAPAEEESVPTPA